MRHMHFPIDIFLLYLFLIITPVFSLKKALVIGITGQDGAYLTDLLLEKGYEVHGIKRRSSLINTERIDHVYNHERLFLYYGDLTDTANLVGLIARIQPDEIYNLAAQSHVKVSFELPEYTAQVDGLGTLRILEAIRILNLCEKTRFYQASSSELYGKVIQIPQDENTPFNPRSPYAIAKQYAYWITKNYREAYGIFASNGILFNHESPKRGETFVTRKITRAVARIALGMQKILYLGNLDAQRDWGHARDYVEAMWLILQYTTPDDWVIATGETHSVRQFVERAFAEVNINIAWTGEGVDEIGYDTNTGMALVLIDPCYFRPTEVDFLIGDPTKAEELLGWHSTTSFEQLIREMIQEDLKLVRQDIACSHIKKQI